jgi:hypothetical protein
MSWQDEMAAAARMHPEVEVSLTRLEELPAAGRQLSRACGIGLIRVADTTLRGQGLAGRVLRELCQAADRNQVILHLTPNPLPRSRGLGKSRLRAWFRARGFTPNVGPGRGRDHRITDAMIRVPKG